MAEGEGRGRNKLRHLAMTVAKAPLHLFIPQSTPHNNPVLVDDEGWDRWIVGRDYYAKDV